MQGSNQTQDEEEKKVGSKEKESKSLFHKFKMENILTEIETAERKKDFEGMLNFSNKLQFLFQLMGNLRNEGHRVLIFSMSKKMLTIIESYLESGIFDKLYPLKPTADE